MTDTKKQVQNKASVKRSNSNRIILENRSLNFERENLQTRSSSNDAYIQFLKSTKKRGL